MNRFVNLVLAVLLLYATCSAGNIFEPWLKDESPRIVEVLSTQRKGSIEVTRLKFLSRTIEATGDEVIIYGVLARPLAEGKHPAVLVCHGGGGYADQVAPQAEGWAERGYVSFCQDQPGICNSSKGSSSGPWLTDKWSTFAMKNGDPTTSALFDGVLAALNGLALLRSRDDVDTSRVGVTGGSWGGYMTTMVTGLAGDRVKAAFAIYGCGFYDLASTWRPTLLRMTDADRSAWLENLDAGRRAAGARAEYFNCAAANDWFFWPAATMRTLAQMTCPTNQLFSPNDSHVIRVPGGTHGPPRVDGRKNRTHMETVWFRHHLQGADEPFAVLAPAGEPRATEEGVEVTWTAQTRVPFSRVWVAYSPGDVPWRLRWWKSVEAEAMGGTRYRAVVPVEDATAPLSWIALATDERNVTVSTLVNDVDLAAAGFDAARARPEVLAEGFEGRDVARRWRRRYADRSEGKAQVVAGEPHAGERCLRITGPVRWGMWGVSGKALGSGDARGICLFARSLAGVPVKGLQIRLVGESDDGSRVEFGAKSAEETEIGTEWQRLAIPWEGFAYEGKGDAPIEMLSSAVGQIRIDTPDDESFDIAIDSIGLMQ